MKILALLLTLTCILLSAETKPQLSRTPLNTDQISIYRDFIKTYDNGSGAKLNIAQQTRPFVQESWQNNTCLNPLHLSAADGQQVHVFGASTFEGLSINLIDPTKHKEADPGEAIRNGRSVDDAVERGFAAGVFAYSEIVFDSTHTHAAFSYSFHCGALCGNGGVVVYELKDGKWQQSKNYRCSSWIS